MQKCAHKWLWLSLANVISCNILINGRNMEIEQYSDRCNWNWCEMVSEMRRISANIWRPKLIQDKRNEWMNFEKRRRQPFITLKNSLKNNNITENYFNMTHLDFLRQTISSQMVIKTKQEEIKKRAIYVQWCEKGVSIATKLLSKVIRRWYFWF